MRFIVAFLLSFLFLGQTVTYALVPLEGNFTPNQCSAYTSIKKKSDPILLEPGKVYQASGFNVEGGDYISIEVNGQDRWVNKNCGKLTLANGSNGSTDNNNGGNVADSCPVEGCAQKYVFAISWQPSFCQTHQGKAECQIQNSDSFDAVNFTLHGLWPDKLDYCGVSPQDIKEDKDGEWEDLPPVSVDQQTNTELSQLMPGVRSKLERHEWIKHGTCDGRNEDTYFDIALDFVQEVNASEVQKLFAQNIGKTVTRSQVVTAFEKSFGEGKAKSLDLKCSPDGLVSEIRLKMRRPLVGEKLANVLSPSSGISCDSVLIDPAGF